MAQKAPHPIPEGMHTVTPNLWFNGNCLEAINFYKKALRAEVVGQIYPGPDGKGVWHSMIKIGDSNIMMADAMPDSWERGPEGSATAGLWLYVEHCDELFNNAVKNGCEVMMQPMDAFWGDRMGKIKDPYGHCWSIATFKWIYTPEEMKQKEQEMLANAPGSHS